MLAISSSIETLWLPSRADCIDWSRLDWLCAVPTAFEVLAARSVTRDWRAPPRLSVPPDAAGAVRRSARAWALTPLQVGKGGHAALERAGCVGSVIAADSVAVARGAV